MNKQQKLGIKDYIRTDKKIKIGIDISNLSPDFYGGIDTYCLGLIKGFSKNYNQCEFQIYLTKEYFKKRKKDLVFNKNFKYFTIDISFFKKMILKLYNRILPYVVPTLIKNYHFDYMLKNFIYSDFKKIVDNYSNILISPNVVLKSYNLDVPTLLNMHDIQHTHFPNFFSFRENNQRKMQYFNSALHATNIVASGKFIKKDLLREFPFIKKKISVILEGVDIKKFYHKVNNNKIEKFFKIKKIKKKSFLFLPAQLWEHKNHITIIKGMKILREKFNNNIILVMCGQKYQTSKYLFDFIKKNKLTNVIYLGVLKSDFVKWCFQNSFATICPALYESSSLVNLESIAAKTVVISSDIPTNLEKKFFFKVNIFKRIDPKSFAKIVNFITKKPELRNKQIHYNNKKIKLFSWQSTSKNYYLKCQMMLNEK
jgi:glycosyltransferase involved in cell wall biosynthesis